ncbi:hypothetical protein RHSIM_RhsimUnG0255800 [Rhododendron simsii]|uniref:Non-specific serine/threonine protein kinase n=1 Tax=Rhododendron simsii TaxID=118357 RepID=A0A834FTA4_RHOSS|nr:hypothetical protein RHSIM_RhsimUnG0255800 [Rhododendron simsii]
MGFFSPGTSKKRYVGIWYKNIPITTVVWVANRETPLFDTSGVLKLTSPGILVLVNGTNEIIWSTNTSRTAQDPVAQLFDSGNMVVRNADDEMKAESLLWQSFDYPGDTFLPGMKLGKNLSTGHEWYLSSWKSDDDPAQGVFTLVLNARGYPQMFIRNGTNDLYCSGPWNGLRFSGIPDTSTIPGFSSYFSTEEVFYTHELTNTSVVTRSVLTPEGYITLSLWVDQTRSWLAMASAPKASCDTYASCGSYGICIINNSPMCECLNEFLPKYPKDWDRFDWSSGCVRKTPLGCHEGGEDGFVKYSNVKLPDTRNSWFDTRMSLEECRRMCLGNCSCMAYANLDIREAGTGCLLWFDDLIDFKELIGGSGQDIYLRMASSESEGKDLLSFDLGTSIGADNATLTEDIKSQNSRNKEVDLPSGYMSPEYALEGLFSVKSDVFSFGVLLLEILSGKRNRSFYKSDSFNLLGYAWDLWKNGRGLDFKDPILEDMSSTNMLLRYVNIGLLCVQESAADRPTMSIVVSMLSNELVLMIGFILESSGYMSPEYALEGLFSVKSDVFSFGVLLVDHPGDTFLSGMKLGKNLLTGREWYHSSWKSYDDPAQEDYSFGFDTHAYPQIILRNGMVLLRCTVLDHGMVSSLAGLQP